PPAQRRAEVRRRVGPALDRSAPGRVRLSSLCAGDGRDLLPVLAGHPRGGDVHGRLVELEPGLCAAARMSAPPGVEVLEAGAGSASACAGAVPADLLLLCGISCEPCEPSRRCSRPEGPGSGPAAPARPTSPR